MRPAPSMLASTCHPLTYPPTTTTPQPEGWLDDEPDMVPDPEAAVPEDWDEEEDGAWEAPMVYNPKVYYFVEWCFVVCGWRLLGYGGV